MSSTNLKKHFKFIRILLGLLLLLAATPVFAQEVYQAHTHVQFISEQNAVLPGQTFWVGVNFKQDEGWHLYWQNPGDSGMPPVIKWHLPSNIIVGDIHWPYPETLKTGPLTSYGFEHHLLLLIPVTIDKSFKLDRVDLNIKVDWLACRQECDPGKGALHLALPVVKDPAALSFNNNKTIFDQARQLWPQALPSLTSHAYLDGNQWQIDIKTSVHKEAAITFFPLRHDVIEHAEAQQSRTRPQGYRLTLTKSHIYPGFLMTLEGVAVNPAGWDEQGKIKAVMIRASLDPVFPKISFLAACLFAFLGGLILNLMPCVLPVLSIKVLNLVDRHPNRNLAMRHALLYTLGVLVCVWSLGILLFILKSAGQWAGWGFQFQSPVFVLVVAAILFMLALNLFGVWEISMPIVSSLSIRQGYQASFLSGILTTIVASPCTAPFMGTALTVAISQPGIVGLAIFTFMGLGLAFPFVLLSAFPQLLSFVPKPGPWMVHLKRVLGLILLVSVVWLLWVFAAQTGLGQGLVKRHSFSVGIQWQKYSVSAVAKAREDHHGVFIDFTADWCINCQVNDRLVLQNPRVVKAFKDKGVIAFKADWTKYDPGITMALSSLGRDSIPVYVYYPSDSHTPIILPSLITPKMIVDLVQDYGKDN